MIDWPASLITDLAARRAVVFFGSGISAHAQTSAGQSPPVWDKYLGDLIATSKGNGSLSTADVRSLNSLLKDKDYLTVCDILKEAVGREAFVDSIKNAFSAPGYMPAKIHEAIWKLDARVVVTPNFDQIYDTYALNASSSTVLIKTYRDTDLAESLRTNDRIVIKVHGTVSSPNHTIFSRREYAKARNEHASFYVLLESMLRTNTFLFLGCGLSDPDIRMLLEDYSYGFPHSRRHFFVIPKGRLGPKAEGVLSDALGLKFLSYDSRDKHTKLVSALEDLVNRVELARIEMGKNQSW